MCVLLHLSVGGMSVWISDLCPNSLTCAFFSFSSKNLPFPLLLPLSAEEPYITWNHEAVTAERLVQALTGLTEVMTFWLAYSGWKHSCPRQESILSYSNICMLVFFKAKINCNSLMTLSPGIELYLLFLPLHFRKIKIWASCTENECPFLKLCIAMRVALRVI